ncbi:hypothetical protein JOF53_002933 [Crossiella equi]|uniref:Uncharacterized protein n=1 Tax=Crossiella equi TaxID=130796 RepID=A0ABS5ABV6_9PSEU|nr:hypothetical protein [Crossiella equi]MBP2474061.1 hypothetical protein [Crossiella equi]
MPAHVVSIRQDRLAELFPHQLAHASTLYRLGLPGAYVNSWRQLLPGVVLLSGDKVTRETLVRAAFVFTSPYALLTGYDALQLHGVPVVGPDPAIHLLVPDRFRPRTPPPLRLERLRHLPRPLLRKGFYVTSLVRATLDAARWARDRREVERLLRLARERVGIAALHAELDGSPRRGQSVVRRVLDRLGGVDQDIRDARARRVVAASGLPTPAWRREVRTPDGALIGLADAWWEEVGLAWRWLDHRRPEGPADALAVAGVHVLATPVRRLGEERAAVAEELRAAYARARLSPRPLVIAG